MTTLQQVYWLETDAARSMFAVARKACINAGFRADDPEYGSAINEAVLRAMQKWEAREQGGCSPESLAAVYAIRECRDVRRMMDDWRRQDEAGAARRRESVAGLPVETPIPMTDVEVLSFVARHGRKRAARLLCMTNVTLRDRLDEISLRIQMGRETA